MPLISTYVNISFFSHSTEIDLPSLSFPPGFSSLLAFTSSVGLAFPAFGASLVF